MNDEQPPFLVGTSGWTYDHWKGLFYPDNLAKSRWFEHYATRFNTVEVNATFYRKFLDQTYIKWRERAPASFCYVLKAPRLITHRKYLENIEVEVKEFWKSASILEEKFGLILLQIAPDTPYDPERLNKALLAFGNTRKIAVEFRHKKWYCEEIRKLLTKLGSVFCNVDSPKSRLTDWVTSDSAYIRLHGRQRWYSHNYSQAELLEIKDVAHKMAEEGARKVYIFFNNDFEGYAPHNAMALKDLLGI